MIITIPTVNEEWNDMVYPYLAFCYKMKFQNREWTGYKELKDIGLDPDWLISLGILFEPTATGAYRFISENIPNLVNIYAIEESDYYTIDSLWTINPAHIIDGYITVKWTTFDNCPIGVNPSKWAVNMFIATILKERSVLDDYVRPIDYFCDYDEKLYDYLSENKQALIKARVKRWMVFGEWCSSSKDMVEEYAYKQVKDAIKKGSFSSQPEYVKKWFEKQVRQSKHKMRCYSYLFSDQTNKEKD